MKRKSEQIHVLFVHNARTTFVVDDLEMLQRHFLVKEWFVRTRLFMKPISLFGALRKCNLLFIWFASLHALLPVLFARLLKIPIVVVTGGYDTANIPEAGYGSQRGGLRKIITNFILRSSDRLITNSQSARSETCRISGIDKVKVIVIYHGVRAQPFTPVDRKERMALTVGGVWRENLYRKGLLRFVQTAGYLPEWEFVLVGKWHDDAIDLLRNEAGANVHFTGFVSEESLAEYYARASVYVQASMHEGFGLSVAEAMTAGCWPVVSNVGSLPEVVGNTGTVLPDLAPFSVANSIKAAFLKCEHERVEAASRIEVEFPFARREKDLGKVINDLLHC